MPVHPDDELEADLLQRDVAPVGEREVQAQARAVVADDELLREVLVEHAGGLVPGEQRLAQAVEHGRADHLLLEVRRA